MPSSYFSWANVDQGYDKARERERERPYHSVLLTLLFPRPYFYWCINRFLFTKKCRFNFYKMKVRGTRKAPRNFGTLVVLFLLKQEKELL